MVSRANLDKQPDEVAAMFDDVARRYDVTNAILSGGNAPLWRIATTKAVDPKPGERILDVACGTGTSTASLAKGGARVVGADFSPGMIAQAREKHPELEFVEVDATKLPFGDDEFDAVTISFGLRNIVDPHAALAEFYRVLVPGVRVVICEFSSPPLALVRAGYLAYLRHLLPTIAKVSSSNPAAYEYLGESIEEWPDQAELAAWLRRAGFSRVAHRNLTAGVVALHRGRKSEDAALLASVAKRKRTAGSRTTARSTPAAPPTDPVD